MKQLDNHTAQCRPRHRRRIASPVVQDPGSTSDNPNVASESSASNEVRDVLSQILRDGAQKMLQAATQKEIDEYLQDRSGIVGEDGRRLVIRNGSLPEREVITGLGPIQLRHQHIPELMRGVRFIDGINGMRCCRFQAQCSRLLC